MSSDEHRRRASNDEDSDTTDTDTAIMDLDILQSLAESVDCSNQMSGFVSTFRLPPMMADLDDDDDDENMQNSMDGAREHQLPYASGITSSPPRSSINVRPRLNSNEIFRSSPSSSTTAASPLASPLSGHCIMSDGSCLPSPRQTPQQTTSQNRTIQLNQQPQLITTPRLTPLQREWGLNLLSPQSVASDATDAVCNRTRKTTTNNGATGRRGLPKMLIPPNISDVGRVEDGNNVGSNVVRSNSGDCSPDNTQGERSKNNNTAQVHMNEATPPRGNRQSSNNLKSTTITTSNNLKKKKTKPSSRKNNLVILPNPHQMQPHPFHRSKSHGIHPLLSTSPTSTSTIGSGPLSPSKLPPPHPMSHVQSYPPMHHVHHQHISPTYHHHNHHNQQQQHHRFAHHAHSQSYTSDASSSEATPITNPARCRACSFSSDISDSVAYSLSVKGGLDNSLRSGGGGGGTTVGEQHSIHAGSKASDADLNGLRYFNDFDDDLSKDSVGDPLMGVNIHLENIANNDAVPTLVDNVPIVDVVPAFMSTNSLLGLSIPYSPKQTPTVENYYEEPLEGLSDDYRGSGVAVANGYCSSTDITPPASPNPQLRQQDQQRHHRKQSSLVSFSESCNRSHRSQHSSNSLNSISNILLNYPNPDPTYTEEQGSLTPTTPQTVDSSSYYVDDNRSLYEDEKIFVQQIHNSGLQSLSFEHVEDTLENTSMEVEMELVYCDSFGSPGADDMSLGSVSKGGSVNSLGSLMSVEEIKEMERRIHCYRKFRKRNSVEVAGVGGGDGSAAVCKNKEDVGASKRDAGLPSLFATPLSERVIITADVKGDIVDGEVRSHGNFGHDTPVASNKASADLLDIIMNIPKNRNDGGADAVEEDSYENIDIEMAPFSNQIGFSADDVDDDDNAGVNRHISFGETKVHPNNNPGWRHYYHLRNLLWWWQLQPSRPVAYSQIQRDENRKTKSSNHRFDDVDFDRNSSSCCSCFYRCLCGDDQGKCNGNSRGSSCCWYMSSTWRKLLAISCLFMLLAWMFSDNGLEQHRSNDVQQYDPLAKENFTVTSRIIDDADDFDGYFHNPMNKPEDDDEFQYTSHSAQSEQGHYLQETYLDEDDVFRRFELEDDVFDAPTMKGYTSFVSDSNDTTGDNESKVSYDASSLIYEPQVITKDSIDTIVVLGERHVGIDWLVGRLKVLYPDVAVSSGFPEENGVGRAGIWFQDNGARRALSSEANDTTTRKHVIVIALWLNPYDWTELMRVDPINSPYHKGLEWEEFVEAEWAPRDTTPSKTMTALKADDDGDLDDVLSNQDEEELESRHQSRGRVLTAAKTKAPVCQHNFSSSSVSPCWPTHDGKAPQSLATANANNKEEPVYELNTNRNGQKYYSVLELRADKIRSEVKGSLLHSSVQSVIPVRYEDLLIPYCNKGSSSDMPGIVGLMDQIEARSGLTADPSVGWDETPKSENQFWPDPIGCTGHVCFPSINQMSKDVKYVKYLNDHIDWHAEQLVGYQKRSLPKPSVNQIVVLGERHSGAEWLVDRLSRCFPYIDINYGFERERPGKYFQAPPSDEIPSTLVIATFLHPYDWLELMRERPINAPTHKDMVWSEFVNSPWKRMRSNLDNSISDPSSATCSFGFSYHEIIPCQTQRDPESDSFPLYELRHSPDGYNNDADEAYSNILDLRSDKILNFLSTAEYPGVVDLISLRYEDLIWDDGTYADDASVLSLPFPGIAGLLEKIRDRTTLVPDVNAGWILDEKDVFKAEHLRGNGTDFDPSFVEWIEGHLNWDVEKRIGYGP